MDLMPYFLILQSTQTYSLTSEQSMQISMEKPSWLMVPSSMVSPSLLLVYDDYSMTCSLKAYQPDADYLTF
jgi:hypothetical protein